MNSNFENCYTSCGCNKTPHAADWGRNGLICFTSCNSVVIYDPTFPGEGGKIVQTLHGHKGRVNSVRWLRNFTSSSEYEFISASADETAILWSWDLNSKTFAQESVLKGHENIVTVADGIVRLSYNEDLTSDKSSLLLATASIDSTVRIWERDKTQDNIKCVDVINWNSGFCLDIRFSVLPNSDLAILACAADDNKVHLFVEQKSSEVNIVDINNKYHKIHTLSGHEDWVRSMDFITDENNLYLATGSQDTHVRVFKFQKKPEQKSFFSKTNNFAITEKGGLEQEEQIIKISTNANESFFSVVLETVLSGHEGWVYGVSWHPPIYTNLNDLSAVENMEISGIHKIQKLKLLSSSMDKTMIIWSPQQGGIWSEEARVGEVGGNMLGFYGGKFNDNGNSIVGHGYQGSFHIWSFDEKDKSWEPRVVVSGHTAEVMDLCWDVKGNYILTVGGDQTTRLHAPWVRTYSDTVTWHEIARPQIHGYDMNCLAMLSENKFVSGAEEKVIRAFTAPNNFMENFRRISNIKIDSKELKTETLPQGASVPALGLSNKPVFKQMKEEGFIIDDEYPDLYFSPIHLQKPPTEENLMQNTLWPEVQKLYGHGYEIYSLAVRQDGAVLASSCKAANPESACIILWNAKTWLQIQRLPGHQLTVTQMSFSPNGHFLLSVSRDRKWCLFGVKEDGRSYEFLTTSDIQDNLHSRVIWSCSWTFDSVTFATGSRDGKIGFWSPVPSFHETSKIIVNRLTHLEFPKESVTALAFSPVLINDFHFLAVGLESGSISIYKYSGSEIEGLWITLGSDLGHDLTVRRLAFRPKLGKAGKNKDTDSDNTKILQLASCGFDHALKVYDLLLNV